MRDDVTKVDVVKALKRLCDGLSRPFGAKIEGMADEYLGSLRRHGIPTSALDRGVSAALDSETGRWPSPGQLAMLSRPFIPRTDGQRQQFTDPAPSCPRCGVQLFFAGFRFPETSTRGAVVVPRLRCNCPPPGYAAEAWNHPDARAWREGSSWTPAQPAAALASEIGQPMPPDDLAERRARFRQGLLGQLEEVTP